MAQLTVQPIVAAGLAATYASAAGGGDTVIPDDRTFLHVKNGGGSPITVTLVAEGTCSFGSSSPTHDRAVSVTNGTEKYIPTGPKTQFADAATGLVSITYSAVTSVTIAAVSI